MFDFAIVVDDDIHNVDEEELFLIFAKGGDEFLESFIKLGDVPLELLKFEVFDVRTDIGHLLAHSFATCFVLDEFEQGGTIIVSEILVLQFINVDLKFTSDAVG